MFFNGVAKRRYRNGGRAGIENREQPVLLGVAQLRAECAASADAGTACAVPWLRLEQGIEASGGPTDVQGRVTDDGRCRAGTSVTSLEANSPTDAEKKALATAADRVVKSVRRGLIDGDTALWGETERRKD